MIISLILLRLVLGGQSATRPKRINPKWLLVAFAVLAPLFGCQSRNTTVPDGLVGVWKSSAPKYADRSFEITKDSVIIRAGQKTLSTRSISNIETTSGKNINFNIFLLNQKEGEETEFSFYYDPKNNGEIRLKNPVNIAWTKERQ